MTDNFEYANFFRRHQAQLTNQLMNQVNEMVNAVFGDFPQVTWEGDNLPRPTVAANLNLDAGYFFAPYVPRLETPPVLDPNSFAPRDGLIRRYSSQQLREGARFYSRLAISNFIDEDYPAEKPAKVNWKEEGF